MRYLHFLASFVFIFTTIQVSGQSKLSLLDKNEMRQAQSIFYQEGYEEALEIYADLNQKYNGNATIITQIGKCHYMLKDYEQALKNFEDVNEGMVDKNNLDYFFYYGMTLQKLGKYNGALEKLEKYVQKAKKSDIKYYGAENYITQCQYAIKAAEKPVTVTISKLSDSINSKYDDYHPSVSVDGSTMIFTSRRDGSTGGELLSDGQYSEDIYVTQWIESIQEWSAAKQAEGVLNTKEYDSNTSISADGNTMFVYRNVEAENKKLVSSTGGGDIYTSTKNETGNWSKPKMVEELNTSFYEGGACMSNDGQTIYFISDRFGVLHGKSYGARDIWYSTLQEDGSWGKPVNMGGVINTEEDEISVFIHPNGKTLFFASAGHHEQNFGGFDIFKSELKNGQWTAPVNLGFPINSYRDEKEIVLSTDGKVAWISSNGTGTEVTKDVDIYQVDMEYYNVLTGESNDIAILKGVLQDASTGLALRGEIKFINTTTNEVATVKTDKDGNYFRTILANTPYKIEVSIDGYQLYTQQVKIDPPKKEKPERRRRSRNEVEQPKTTETYTVKRNIDVQRENPIEVVSKDLFKKQSIRFEKTIEGYTINNFSKGILEMYAQQLVLAPGLALELTAHFDNSVSQEEAVAKSSQLGEIVKQFIQSKGGDPKRINIVAVGGDYPVASNDSEQGRASNRRVEIRIIL